MANAAGSGRPPARTTLGGVQRIAQARLKTRVQRRVGGGGTTLPATRSASATVVTEPSFRRTFSFPPAQASRCPTTSLYAPLGSRRRSDTRRPTSEGDTETTYRAENRGPM